MPGGRAAEGRPPAAKLILELALRFSHQVDLQQKVSVELRRAEEALCLDTPWQK
jgi:hypothetical protein